METITNQIEGYNINSDTILKETSSGIIEQKDGYGFRLIPDTAIKKEKTYSEKELKIENAPTISRGITNKENFFCDNIKSTHYSVEQNKVSYSFGITGAQIGNCSPLSSCGFQSEEMTLSACDYIQLEVKEVGGENNSIEYSIIEQDKETPILPIDQERINKEKLFFGLPTRFSIDPNGTTMIYKNNKVSEYRKIDEIPFNNQDVYTISYLPTKEKTKYSPTGAFKIRIIQRCYTDGSPATIGNMIIRKYGGEMPWTM